MIRGEVQHGTRGGVWHGVRGCSSRRLVLSRDDGDGAAREKVDLARVLT